MAALPLSTLLSQVVVAHTIELDNEFERRFRDSGGGARVTSWTMWANLLRFVGDGVTVGELVVAVGLPGTTVLSRVGGVERWRYVSVGGTTGKRDGYGSGPWPEGRIGRGAHARRLQRCGNLAGSSGRDRGALA